jgi:deoxyribodipyrimidine photo-lyase
MGDTTPAVMWFRRDLRLADNPALLEAAADGPVLPLFVLDPALWGPSGPSRRAYLGASLRALDSALRQRGSQLSVVRGDPARRVALAARAIGARRVHVAADFGPYGHRRDLAVEQALAGHGVELVRTGSPYAVAPGRVTSGSGEPYRVYTPFSRAWADHGWRAPVDAPHGESWLRLDEDTAGLPEPVAPDGLVLPEAGEAAALRQWAEFLDRVGDYDDERDRPDLDTTSRMSVHLKWGEIHPRTMLADLARLRSDGAATYRKEIAWREFFADVLFARPETAREYLRPAYARMRYDDPGPALDAWRRGRTGFPVVDAGMRQLRATGWMHNRVRMIVASFLVKDLHLEWQHGARHFMRWLADGDLASNQQNWQWAAGSGVDAAPYFRVFNPTTQGRKFDARGAYVRRWVPELAGVADPHDPSADDRDRVGYPLPIVDHAAERREALDRWEEIR